MFDTSYETLMQRSRSTLSLYMHASRLSMDHLMGVAMKQVEDSPPGLKEGVASI